MKKLVLIAATMATCIAMADTEIVDGIKWTFETYNGEAIIGCSYEGEIRANLVPTAIPKSTVGDIVIPKYLGGCRVTEMYDTAFYGCTKITSVTIPETMHGVILNTGDDCNPFTGCSSLISINVEAGNDAYYSKDGVWFEENLCCNDLYCNDTYICGGRLMVYPGGRKGAYTIPSDVEEIRPRAFSGCTGLTELTIPKSVDLFETDLYPMFDGCSALTSINVEAGNKGGYYSVDGVVFTKGSAEDEYGKMYSWVTLNVYPVGRTGFYEVRAGATDIDALAFYTCSGLTSVTIPSSVTYIGENAFYGCSSLRKIYVEKGDTKRVKKLMEESGFDVKQVTFIEGGSPSSDPTGDGGFTGEKAMTFNGLIKDADRVMCGIVQIATAKATRKGVKVSGFAMLEDGKKQTLKAVTMPIENGQLNVTTKVGKNDMTLTITGDGFTGTLGEMSVETGNVDENTGIVSGTLKMSYFDAKTGKVKTKSIKLAGITSNNEAVGRTTIKGETDKSFVAEIQNSD